MSQDKTQNEIRFLYNGLKVGKGKLQKAGYSYQRGHECCGRVIPEQITIYGSVYPGFSEEVRAELTVENDSDSMTDYFECDRIRITFEHPRFLDVAAATTKALTRNVLRCAKKGAEGSRKSYQEDLNRLNEAVVRRLLNS